MESKVTKKYFLGRLTRSPELVKKLVEPSQELLRECIEKNYACLQYVAQWTDLGFLQRIIEYAVTIRESSVPINLRGLLLGVDVAIRSSLPEKDLKICLDKFPSLITFFPQATYQDWFDRAERLQYDTTKDIPKAFLDETMILKLVECGNFPSEFYTEEICDLIMQRIPKSLNHIPDELWNKERRLAFFKVTEENWPGNALQNMTDPDIIEVIRGRLTDFPTLMDCIHKDLWDEDMVVHALTHGYRPTDLPKRLEKSKRIMKAGLIHHGDYYTDMGKFSQSDLMEMIAELVGMEFEYESIINRRLEPLVRHLNPENLIKAVELYPDIVLRTINIGDQTREIVAAAMSSGKSVDTFAEYLNFQWVKPEDYPLFVGIESERVKNFVEKFFTEGGKKKYARPADAEMVTVDWGQSVPDSEEEDDVDKEPDPRS